MSEIEWTDSTWNPVVGCSAASPGCDNCYAAGLAASRLRGHRAYRGLAVREGGGSAVFTGEIRVLADRLDVPLRWRAPRMVFVCSMSDLFHPRVPTQAIAEVWSTMVRARQHTFQVLTKRPKRAAQLLASGEFRHDVTAKTQAAGSAEIVWPAPNVWIGTSIEADQWAWRADHLRRTPAVVRFLSCEPLLGPVPSLDLGGIDWVIAGGESGPAARPMRPDWVRGLRDRCTRGAIPFFFKQWGGWRPTTHLSDSDRVEVFTSDQSSGDWVMERGPKHHNGRHLDGRTWDQMPDRGASS